MEDPDLVRPIVSLVHLDDNLSIYLSDLFFGASLPVDLFINLKKGALYELAHGVSLSSSEDVFLRRSLHHQPHTLNVVPRVSPVARSVKVSNIKLVSLAAEDLCHRHTYLSCNEGLATPWPLMIEKYSSSSVKTVSFSIVDCCPMCIELGAGVGALWSKWRRLRETRTSSEHLRRRILIELSF